MKKPFTYRFANPFFAAFSKTIWTALKISLTMLLICSLDAKMYGQNLVLNPSFENTTACPISVGEFDNVVNWYSTNSSYDSCSSPDLYAACAPVLFGGSVNVPDAFLGYQNSRTGTHHAGIILADGWVGCTSNFPGTYREYIEATFSAPLVAGQRYLVRFYASLPNNTQWGSNSISAYFTNTRYTHDACSGPSLISATPQLDYCGPPIMDTARWVPVEWIYTAAGGERYMTIGNFRDDNATNFTSLNCNTFNPYVYYFIDDVNVSLVQPNQCGFSIFTDSVNANCGTNTGSVTATAIGCTSPFSYVWSAPGGTTSTLSNLGAGTYTVSVTDAVGCRQTATVAVNSVCPTTLCRNTNGSLTVSGGTAPYTWQTWDSIGRVCPGGIVFGNFCISGTWTAVYGWKTVSSGAATTYTPPAGTDTLRVIDNAGTTLSTNNIATLPLCASACNLTATAGTRRNVSCLGGANGFARVTTTGGTAPLTYTWSGNVSTRDSANNLAAGTYTVTVRDVNNCTATASFAIMQPASSVSVGLAVNLPAACGVNSGRIRVSATGGTPAYTYTWSPNVSTIDSATNLAAGTYRITVSDQGSCTAVLVAVVGSSTAVTVTPGTTRNVSCLGGNNGFARATVTGGTAPYTYTWSPNISILDSANNLAAGTYSVTARDVNNCTGAASFTITQPSSGVSVALATNLPASCGANTGKIKVNVSGGTPAYTYSWAPNISTVDSAINLAAGTYRITVSDQGSCTALLVAVVASTPGVTVTPGATRNVSCSGGNDGFARVTVSGGTTPYTYTWSPNTSTLDSANNLAAGTYAVTVRDANNCTGSTSFTITQPAAALAANPVVVPASCGNNTGIIRIIATGGTAPYTYIWSPNVSTVDSAINLAPGTYNATVTDARGCTATTAATIAPSTGITVSAGSTRNVSCLGGSNGFARVIVSGGTTPYSYLWSPNTSILDSANNLAAGTYSVTVRDANNCTGTASFTITQPATALAVSNTATQATCNTNNGRIVLRATGGTPGYTYTWSPNVSTADSAIGLAPNTYNITVTDAQGCTALATVAISLTPSVLVSAGTTTSVSCFGGSNGRGHVTATGGATPYIYTWSPNVSTADSAINLAAGTYNVTVRDANNCTASTSITITQPAAALAATSTTVATTCGTNNGRVVFTVTGGTPAYSYVWSPNVSTVDSAINLGIGTYNVTVTDARGCTLAASASISSSSGFSVSAGPQVNINCFGLSTGSAHVNVSGGATPYTYTWSPNVSTVDSAVNLAAGSYSVTVRDASTCSGVVIFNITQPASALAVTAVTSQGVCGVNSGRIILTTTGGTPVYTYTWSPNISTADSAVNLSANTYNVTVTDAGGCTTSISRAISVTPAVTATPGVQRNVSCFGGSNGAAFVNISGGTAPFTYIWSNFTFSDSLVNVPAGTYYSIVRDANNCLDTTSFIITQPAAALTASVVTTATTCANNNGRAVLTVAGGTTAYTYTWSPNVSAVDSAISLAANTYNVTVTDANGCHTTLAAVVPATPGVTLALGATRDISCHGANNGSVHVTAASGVTPYSYTWSPNVSTVDSAIGLAQGTYSVTVRDANGCEASVSYTVNEPQVLGVSISTTLAGCNTSNGTATANVSGGTGTMVYQWSAGGSTTNVDGGLAAGSYTLTVTDGNLCQVTAAFTISNFTSPAVTIASTANLLCNGVSNGSIHLTVSNGSPAYSYLWSPVVSTTDSAVNLAAGTYNVTVTDANNCTAIATATLTQPNALTIVTTSQNADCGANNGWAHITVTGGTGAYTYQWTGSASVTDSATGIAGGTYSVTVTDGNACNRAATVTVGTNGGPAAPAIGVNGPNTFCQGGSVVLTSSALTGNTWSNGATTQSITVPTSGTFTVTQTVGGCTSPASAPVTVTVNPIPGTPVITASGPLSFCPGGSVTLTSDAATGNVWNTTETTQSITVTASGTYTVSVVLAGCSSLVSAPVSVTVLTSPSPVITGGAAVCPGDSVQLDATVGGATAYVWNNGATIASFRTGAGFYAVTVTAGGCTGTNTLTIATLPVLGPLVLNDSFMLCIGDTVTLDATTADATSYQWSGGGLTDRTPIVMVKSDSTNPDATYYVDVSNSCGSITDSVQVVFQACDCKMVVGNAFTPNGDGKNEKFGPVFLCNEPKSLSMQIYNRWGQKIFDSDQLNEQWDGTYRGDMQPEGVYTYTIQFTGMENHKEKTFKMVGNVALIR